MDETTETAGMKAARDGMVQANVQLEEIEKDMMAWIDTIRRAWDSSGLYIGKTACDRMPPADTAQHIVFVFLSYARNIPNVWSRFHDNMHDESPLKMMSEGLCPKTKEEPRRLSWWRRLFGRVSST